MKPLKIGKTMFFYILKKNLHAFMVVAVGMSVLLAFLDIMSTASRLPHLKFPQLLEMEILNFASLFLAVLPYIVMFAFMYGFFNMNREKQTTIQFSIGLSPLQILIPSIIIAFILGIIYTSVLTPVASITHNQYKQRWNMYSDTTNTAEITITRSNLWLREKIADGYRIIHSPLITNVPITLYQAQILEMDNRQNIQRAYRVDKISLQDAGFLLHNGTVQTRDSTSRPIANLIIPTTVNNDLIKNIITKPVEMSFWQLSPHIQSLATGGLNAKEYIFTYHKLLSMPFMFIALVLFAAYFTMRPYTRIVPAKLIGIGTITAFLLFFFLNLTQAMVFLTPLPPYVLGWLPTVIVLLLGGFLTLSSEKVG